MAKSLCSIHTFGLKEKRSLLNKHGPFSFTRSMSSQKAHNEPKELAWQWQVKKDPSIHHCSIACVNKICPKKSFFPRLKKVHVPTDIHSCERKPKKMTWYEYFSFLLPDSMTAKKPPLRSCRKLLAMRLNKCLDPLDWDCCKLPCIIEPKEWYGQGVVHAIISKNLCELQTVPIIKPCPPPDHMVPRCVIAKTGALPSGKLSVCVINDTYKVPYGDIKGSSLIESPKKKFVCRFKCFEDSPKIQDKKLKLTCRWYDEYKEVVCPKQMFTRFRSVKITPCGDLEPVKASAEKGQTNIEIKKGVCGRSTLLRPRGIRNFSTSTILERNRKYEIINKLMTRMEHIQPNRPAFHPEKLMNSVGFEIPPPNNPEPSFRPELIPSRFDPAKRKVAYTGEKTKSPTNVMEKLRAKQRKPFKEDTKLFSISASNYKKKMEDDKTKKEDEEEHEPICSGCVGIQAALDPKKKIKTGYKARCAKRPGRKCKQMEPGPNDPPVVSPYWKCRSAILSRCNQARPVVCKEKRPPMPCETPSKKIHISATKLFSPIDCKPECSLKENKQLDKGSCYKQKDDKSKGIICKIASLFGIGCGKKK